MRNKPITRERLVVNIESDARIKQDVTTVRRSTHNVAGLDITVNSALLPNLIDRERQVAHQRRNARDGQGAPGSKKYLRACTIDEFLRENRHSLARD